MNRAVRLFLFSLAVPVGSLCVAIASGSLDASAEEAVPGEVDHATRAEPVELPGALAVPEEENEAPKEKTVPLTLEERMARSRERTRQRVELMTTTATREAVDPEWGPAAERRIAERFAANAPAGFKLRSTTCKTSLCVAEVETASREASARYTDWDRLLGNERALIYRGGDGDGSPRTLVFMPRDGHALPGSGKAPRGVVVAPQTPPGPPSGAANDL